jgi:hypothetical protein
MCSPPCKESSEQRGQERRGIVNNDLWHVSVSHDHPACKCSSEEGEVEELT